jgi:hypothetical protein
MNDPLTATIAVNVQIAPAEPGSTRTIVTSTPIIGVNVQIARARTRFPRKRHPHPGLGLTSGALAVLVAASTAATVARFVALRTWVFSRPALSDNSQLSVDNVW